MRTELLLLLVIMAINSQYLRKLEDTDTEESCKKAGKDFKKTTSAKCQRKTKTYDVESKSECIKGTWTGTCSAASITEESKCKGTPVFTEAKDGNAATCIVTVDGNEISITDADRLANSDGCQKELVWDDDNGKCSISGITNKDDCETANPTFTEAKGKCVEKSSDSDKSSSSTSFNSFLSFKFCLVLITYLLF